MAGKINKNLINKQIFENRAVKKMVYDIVNKEIEKEKNLFRKNFDTHPVTQELDGGEDAQNNSGTLGGYGNLFSFLGFNKAANPTSPVKNLIQTITLENNVKYSQNTFKFRVIIPSKEEFAAISKLPWENGRSWLFDIERGISGLGAYLYGRFQKSRSGSGIQNKYNYSNKNFRPVKYFNKMYIDFIKKLGII